MYRTLLISLLLSSSLAHAATEGNTNSALLENISRFESYEQTAQQISQGQTNIIPRSAEENRLQVPTQQVAVTPAETQRQQPMAAPAPEAASVYESVKLLISNGTLTDKQKIKLISMLSS